MKAPPFRTAFLLPTFWPTWLGLGFLRLVHALPIPWQLWFGEGLGWLFGRLVASRRQVVRVNLELCFPELGEAAREDLIDAHFRALGAGIIEAGLAWWASDARLKRHSEVRGLERLDAAQSGGHGALILTGHFTTLELGARILAMHRPFHPMYRPIKNPMLDCLMFRWRSQRAGLDAVPRDDLRRLVRALRGGRGVWYAPDQTLDRRFSVWSPFFGVPTLTITATARLARLGRARVVPYFPRREGARWILEVQPALEDFPGDADDADAARVNAVIEAGVRSAVPQYFWVHKRFKWRPEGEPNPYAGR